MFQGNSGWVAGGCFGGAKSGDHGELGREGGGTRKMGIKASVGEGEGGDMQRHGVSGCGAVRVEGHAKTCRNRGRGSAGGVTGQVLRLLGVGKHEGRDRQRMYLLQLSQHRRP